MLFRLDLDCVAEPARAEEILHVHAFRQPHRAPLQKLIFDRVFAAFALLFFLPFLLLVALLILVADGRPVFFTQERIGQNGRPFRCLKFRTMVRDADARLKELLDRDPDARREWETTRKLSNDPRIHCIGAILRKTSLDELPQFLNVLRGEMSVVGPRPIVMEEAQYYGTAFKYYIAALPGVTGAWQVSGRSNTSFEERVALDIDYVQNWNFWRDVRIVMRTVSVVLKQDGAR